MIPFENFIVGLLFLVGLSIFDFYTFKKRKAMMPSVITTLFMIVAFIIGYSNVQINILLALSFGVLLAIFMTDMELWAGYADFKIFVACSMLFMSMRTILWFALLVIVLAILAKGIINETNIAKKLKLKYIPFIPIIAVAFIGASMI